ncbi:hypothetical protein tinsulaeT_32400 [Thalassotalea insulae]|uniref:DUF2141 domain-containing protein n=1 Tax=Thalassotalea insulae TaxID=2056778 RepID=A0ABQ6GZH3_9GAMM|nr:DUF2141 domain-containing protein [Thalassotalea insulae]GLX79900.1 hypothetical protein tinsulaeT_32400 [Thalassotalea insulae]
MKLTSTLAFVFTTTLVNQTVLANTVNFEINAVKNDSGKIYAQIFKGEANYKQNIAESSAVTNAKKGKVKVTFNNLPAGDYAIRFFHDEDNDGQLATNLIGMPKEGYGFSNDAKPNFGPVDFKHAKFVINGENSVVINKTTAIY